MEGNYIQDTNKILHENNNKNKCNNCKNIDLHSEINGNEFMNKVIQLYRIISKHSITFENILSLYGCNNTNGNDRILLYEAMNKLLKNE